MNDELAAALAQPVHVRGESRPFGALTADDVRARADELRGLTGWGPMARVAPVARAWRELALLMARTGAETVAGVDPAELAPLARALWVAPLRLG